MIYFNFPALTLNPSPNLGRGTLSGVNFPLLRHPESCGILAKEGISPLLPNLREGVGG